VDSQSSKNTLILNEPKGSGNTITIGGTEYADTMSIDMSDLSSYGASVSSVASYSTASSAYGNITINNGGSSGSSYLYSSGAGNNAWGTITAGTNHPSIHVTGEAEFDSDIKIKGVSILKTLNEINNRLAILVPDPEKLEHFEALKKAYDHYKMIEALCELPKEQNDS
jgi:hypothetical protein